MPPLPPSGAEPLSNSPLVNATPEGFHASLVVADLAPQEVFYETPTKEEKLALREAWNKLYEVYGGMIGPALARKAIERWRRFPRHLQMVATMRHLSKHSEDLSSYILPGITPPELLALIPPLDQEIAHLLSSPPFQPFGPIDAKVLVMARWFKNDFMRWADPIKCKVCGGDTTGTGGSDATDQELADGSGRVELHTCKNLSCGAVTRYPRYLHMATLVKTRSGRCGEWAHLFLAFLRAMGVEARYIWNSEDHVWTEYWSPALGHWVHADSCEATINKPLLYARGWGKKQSFCLAFGPYGAEDVSKAYVDDWSSCQLRRTGHGWSEYSLRLGLLEQTIRCRSALSPTALEEQVERDGKHKRWIEDEALREREAERDELGGRTSGTADWRAARQELGLPKIARPNFTVKQRLVHNWTLHGDAKRQGDCILLTDGAGQTSGSFSSNAIPQSTSFRVNLKFKLEAPPGAGEADGIAIVFSPDCKLGEPGYGMGYSGLGGKGDWAVEIDTYRTQDHADDPPTPHISVHSPSNAHHRHSLACTPKDAIPNLSDGKSYSLELVFVAPKREVTGFLVTPEGEEIGLWQVSVPPGDGKDWYVGVTGACGGLWQKQEILSVSVEAIEL